MITVVVATLLVVGTAAVATQATDSSGGTSVQSTTTAVADRPTAVSMTNFSSPDRVRVGTAFTVSATIDNRGNESVYRRVAYRIAGNVLAAELVRIPANGTTDVTFDIAGADTDGFPTGTFTHGVFTDDAEATTNLTLVPAGATTTEVGTTATPTAETVEGTTPAETTTVETTPAKMTPVETTVETTTVETTPAETTPAETTPAETTVETTGEPRAASITFEAQTSNGTAITVRSVTVPRGGFVVVHDASVVRRNVVGSILGVSDFLETGTHRNVTVRLDERVNESQRLVAIAYRDSNGNREFDFVRSNRTADGPYRVPDEREAVNDIARVTITTDNETTVAGTTTRPAGSGMEGG